MFPLPASIFAVLGLALLTWVVLAPERFMRTRKRDSVADLIALNSGDRRSVESLIEVEVERGATSRSEAAERAVFRLMRDRRR